MFNIAFDAEPHLYKTMAGKPRIQFEGAMYHIVFRERVRESKELQGHVSEIASKLTI